MSYSSQEIVASKKYQNLSPSQKSMFLQVFGNRSDITPEMFNSFVTQTSNLPDDKQSDAGGTALMASPLVLPIVTNGVKYIYNTLTGKVVEETGKEVTKNIAEEVTKQAVKQGAKEATKEASSGIMDTLWGSSEGTSTATEGASAGAEAYPVGTSADGGTMMSDGTTQAPTGGIQSGGVGGWLGAAKAGYDGVKLATDYKNLDADERAKQAKYQGQRAVGAYFTGGLSELGATGVDAVFGKGSTNKVLGLQDKFYDSKIGKILMPGGALVNKGINSGIKKLLGNVTKYTEFRELKDAVKRGDISEQDAQGYMENSLKFGRGGREGINVEQNYQDRLKSDGQVEADRFKKYSQLVKEGNDIEANKLLRGKDIMGYANVMRTISDTTGKKYGDYDMTTREKLAQTIADYNRENQGAIYGDKGTLNVKLDDTLKQKLMGALGTSPVSKPNVVAQKPVINSVQQSVGVVPQTEEEKQKVNLNDLKKLWR